MNVELEFRRGFCGRLASRGVAPEDVSTGLEKLADGSVGGMFGSAANKSVDKSLGAIFSGLGSVGKATAFGVLIAPALVAGLAGHLLAKSKKVSPADIRATSDTILIKELEEQRRMLEERQAARVYR